MVLFSAVWFVIGLFDDWKYRGTCISVEEYFERAEADLSVSSIVSEDRIINYLEIMDNFVKLYISNENFLQIDWDHKDLIFIVNVSI